MWCKETWKNDYPGFTDGSQSVAKLGKGQVAT